MVWIFESNVAGLRILDPASAVIAAFVPCAVGGQVGLFRTSDPDLVRRIHWNEHVTPSPISDALESALATEPEEEGPEDEPAVAQDSHEDRSRKSAEAPQRPRKGALKKGAR